jgi:lipoprotein-anchoring transpeptidase ErfK/SrfK
MSQSSAVAETLALDAAAQANTRAYIREQTAIYLEEVARQEAERAREEEEARRQAAAEAYALDLAAAQPPAGVSFGPDEGWIAVDLTTQRATAFVGAQPVHVARVTTGVPGWETPTGDFRIYVRIENETMDSLTIGIPRDDSWGYYLENVYFTQYFVGGVALHYNYWRADSYFGNVPSSHGCVGMRYDDAKFFWDFAAIGTRVVVHN